ncbi:DUF5133 domain-containing protein [Streptomyces sp. 900105755]|uniref:DUF5133 domain-containing protein n=1 Tax=Streptomyces sp. Ag109_O5-10 TaxID=1855349 RepID=UPI00089B4043|nr:DUF5133 domain-containing protein [Streptomyces sp. Ag109_O5-10]SED76018.1 protein of unknown function [Streptomyces sp. Ag109_O5-10]
MLTPHPATLRRLVDDYERARTAETASGPEAGDLAYTLCVITGTRDIAAALAKARHLLAADATADLPSVTIPATPTVPVPAPTVLGDARDRASVPLAVGE